MPRFLSRRIEAIALAAILAIGAYLRLARLDLAQFRPDDVVPWNIARQLVQQPQVLDSGMSSSAAGFANGPFQSYLLLPATLITSNPLAAYYLVAVLNIAGIALFWGFVRSYWGRRLALLAALLYAVNPWAVVFSRRIWADALMAPFTILLIWSLCDLARFGRRRDGVLPAIWLAVVTQVYVGALADVVLAALGAVLGLRKLRPAYLLAGCAIGLLLAGPYLFGYLMPNLGTMSFPMGSGDQPAQVDLKSMALMLHLVSAEGYQAFANNSGNVLDATRGLPKAISLLGELFLAIGLVAAVAQASRLILARRMEEAAPYAVPAAAVLLPALLLIRHSAEIYIYYLLVGFPMHVLLVAMGIRLAWHWYARLPWPMLEKPLRLLVAGITVATVATHLLLAQAFSQAIRDYWPESDYGVPMRYSLQAMDEIRRLDRESHYARVLMMGSEIREGALFAALRPEMGKLSFFDSGDTLVIPAADSQTVLYVVPENADPISTALAGRFGAARMATVEMPGYGLRYSFLALRPGDLARAAQLPEAAPDKPLDARLGDYLQLLGYDLPSRVTQNEPLRVTTYWRVLRRPEEDINLFVHLIGNLGSLWAQADRLNYPVDQWQPGDLFVQTNAITLPVGAPPVDYHVEAGAYYRASGRRLAVQTPTQADDRLRFGSVRLDRVGGAPSAVVADVPVRQPAAVADVPVRQPTVLTDVPLRHYGTPLDIPFESAIGLRGYQLSGSPAPGRRLRLSLFWQARAAIADDYTIFVHLTAADGQPVAQADGPPAFGMFSTSSWHSGDLVRDDHEVPIPNGLAKGRYWLVVGLYVPPDGPRLSPASEPSSLLARLNRFLAQRTPLPGRPFVDGDRVVLERIEIK